MPIYTRAFASTLMCMYTCAHTKKWERVTWLSSLYSGENISNLNIVFKGENLIFIGMELEIFIQDKRQERWLQQLSSAMQRILIWRKREADEGRSAGGKPHSSAYHVPSSKCSKDDLFSSKSGRMSPSRTPVVLMQDLATVEGTQTSNLGWIHRW